METKAEQTDQLPEQSHEQETEEQRLQRIEEENKAHNFTRQGDFKALKKLVSLVPKSNH
jgi:hypothetical protein